MPNSRSQAENEGQAAKILSWDDAITDAKQRIKDLTFSLKVFSERKKKGDPWPLAEQQKSPQEGG